MIIGMIPQVTGAVYADTHTHEGWTAWSTTDALPSEAGNYYLTVDVTLSGVQNNSYIVPQGTMNLCLEGHTIGWYNNKYPDYSRNIMRVYSGSTVHIYDLEDNSGKIKKGAAAGNGTYGLHWNHGGGIFIDGGTVYFHGGTICENSGVYGGGVYVCNGGQFIMSGGVISDNMAGVDPWFSAAGVHVENGGIFTMTGGTITNNHAEWNNVEYYSTWGVFINPTDTQFNISGNPMIIGNTGSSGERNVLLGDGARINVTGPLSEDAKIGVAVWNDVTEGNQTRITNGLPGNGTRSNFVCNQNDWHASANNYLTLTDGELEMVYGPPYDLYDLWIAGEQVTGESLSGPGWEFAPDTNTLTLSDVNIGGEGGIPVSSDAKAGIYTKDLDLTIKGTGQVNGKIGIYAENGSLTITSEDERAEMPTDLTVTSNSNTGAIYAKNDLKVINSKLNIKDEGSGVGVYSGYGSVTIEDSKVDTSSYYGIYAEEDVTITDSTVSVSDSYYGLYYYGAMAITGSEVDIAADEYGIYADYEGVSISNSKVTITDFEDVGIYAYEGKVEISDNSTVIVGTEDDRNAEQGIYVSEGEVSIKDSEVKVGYCSEYGIYAYHDIDDDDIAILIDNSEVTVSAGEAGIYAYYDDIVIAENNKVTANDCTYPIWVYYGDIDIKNSKITAVGESNSYAISAYYGKLTISGAKTVVEADGYDYPVFGGEGIELNDVEIVEPEGGKLCANSTYIEDAEGNTAHHVLIKSKGGIVRLAGNNRYDTAITAAEHLRAEIPSGKFDNVIIASGADFPDALSATYLACVKNAPILLVGKDSVSINKVTAYINENLAEGGKVYIVGGTGAVDSSVEGKLTNGAERLAGSNRYTTNIEVLKAAGVSGKDVLVASGKGYADALSASAAGRPILLVADALTPDQKTYLEENKLSFGETAYIVGGTGAVSATVETQIKDYVDETERLAGSNRYDTSRLVAETFFTGAVDTMVIASGKTFPDGLSGGPVALKYNAPLILVADGAAGHARTIFNDKGMTRLVVMGGTGAVSKATAEMIADPLKEEE